MQIVQKIYIESQEMMPDMKINTGSFWFQNKKYVIKNGIVYLEDTWNKSISEIKEQIKTEENND